MLILKDKYLRKSILVTALPAMAEMSLYMLIGVVDVAIVGRLGATPLAAVSLGAEIFFGAVLLLEALATGSSILAAHAKGANDPARINAVSVHTLFLALVLGILVTFLGLSYTRELVGLFSVEKAVLEQAVSYLYVVFAFAPLVLMYIMLNTIFRGVGRTDIPMKIALLVNIINCVGDYVLVYGKLGLPALGVAGAAWASSIAQTVGFIITFYLLLKGTANEGHPLNLIRMQKSTLGSIFRLGIPTLGEQFFMTLSGLVSTYLIVVLGTVSYASHQVAITVESLSYMPGIGIAIASTALVGQAVGAIQASEAKKTARGTLELALLLMGSIGILFAVFPYFIAGLFSTDPQIIRLSGSLLRIAAFEQITIAISMVLGGALKGSGDTRSPMLINLVFVVFFRIPLMYVLIRIWHCSIQWIWCMFVLDWFLRAITYCAVYKRSKWFRSSPQVQ